MQSIYAFETLEEAKQMQSEVAQIIPRLSEYIEYLRKDYQLHEMPQAIIWTNKQVATTVLSETPIPAYTNDKRIVMSPNIVEWRQLWQDILPEDIPCHVRGYFDNWEKIHILQIVGHEITHHLAEFAGEFIEMQESEEIWFEEGMVEYLSRRYFFTTQQFQEVVNIETDLVNYFEAKYGVGNLKEFGRAVYETSELLEIFYYYWKSFLKICELVEKIGSPKKVFKVYHRWVQESPDESLIEWFYAQV